jgi:hypothetical protein
MTKAAKEQFYRRKKHETRTVEQKNISGHALKIASGRLYNEVV